MSFTEYQKKEIIERINGIEKLLEEEIARTSKLYEETMNDVGDEDDEGWAVSCLLNLRMHQGELNALQTLRDEVNLSSIETVKKEEV